MKFALVNPNWHFEGSIYFGCREPHLPLEYGYSKALLESSGHEVALVDGQMDNLTLEDIRRRVRVLRTGFHGGHYGPELSVLAVCAAGVTRPPGGAGGVQDIAGT